MTKTSIPHGSIFPIICLAVAACGGSSDGTGGAGGGSGGGSGDCNALVNIGQVVHETADPGSLPTMTGGTLVDGTYVLVSNVQYATSSADSDTHKRTIQIAGDTIQLVNSDNGGPDIHATLKIAPSGSALNETAACPVGLQITPGTYTATATTLAIQKNGSNQVETYDKQ